MRPCRRFLFPILVCGCGGAAVRAQVWAPLQHQVTREWLSRENVEYPRRFPPAGEYPARIPLVTDPGAAPLGEVCPLGAGFPLREGQVTALGTLALVGAAQGRVPAVFEARTTWPDGSARWVWVDFAGLPDRACNGCIQNDNRGKYGRTSHKTSHGLS